MALVPQLRAPSPHQTQVSDHTLFTIHCTCQPCLCIVYTLMDNDIRKYASCDRCDPILFLQFPSFPIIDSVSAMALSLFAFRVNITLLTDGGRRVTLYTVSECVWMCVDVCVLCTLNIPYTWLWDTVCGWVPLSITAYYEFM